MSVPEQLLVPGEGWSELTRAWCRHNSYSPAKQKTLALQTCVRAGFRERLLFLGPLSGPALWGQGAALTVMWALFVTAGKEVP